MTLRRSLGAVAAAALAVLVLTAGDMSVTDLLSVRTYAEESYTQYQSGNGPGASAVALPPLVVFGALILVGVRALLKVDPARVLSASARSRDWRLGRWRVPVGLAVAATFGLAFALPVFSLFWHAGHVVEHGQGHWSALGLGRTLASTTGELFAGALLPTVPGADGLERDPVGLGGVVDGGPGVDPELAGARAGRLAVGRRRRPSP